MKLCEPCWTTFSELLSLGRKGLIGKIDWVEQFHPNPKARQALAQLKDFVEELFEYNKSKSSYELLMREMLQGLNINFAEQVRVSGHKVDFVIPLEDKKKSRRKGDLIIEVDGGHHKYPENRETDASVTSLLREKGNQVLRFSSDHLLENVSHAKRDIMKAMTTDGRQPQKAKPGVLNLVT